MAFIKEESIREEEKREFHLRPYGTPHTPECWAIDRETGSVLFFIGGGKEMAYAGEKYYGFSYHGSEVCSWVTLIRHFLDTDDGSSGIRYELKELCLPKDLTKEEVLPELREAIKAWSVYGTTKLDF